MSTQSSNYALDKVRAIRADNARQYELGKFADLEVQSLREVDRLQEMNLSLCNARRPEKDLVKDVPGFQVPAVSDPVLREIIASNVPEKDR